MNSDPRPPALLRRIVRASLPFEDREPLLQELDGLYRQRVRSSGRSASNTWYARQALSFAVRVGARRVIESAGGMRALASDARVALRSFRQRPVFALAFVITLAVGTGVVATVYAAARWLLLRPVPGVAAPEGLTTLRLGFKGGPPHVAYSISHPDYRDLRERLPVDGALAASTPIEVDVRPGDAEPRRVAGAMVSSNYFSVLGARMAAGRAFLAEEEAQMVEQPVVILSHSLAKRVAPDGQAIGSELRVNGRTTRIVGVTAPGFRGASLPGRDELWLPLSALPLIDPSTGPQAIASRGEGIWRHFVARNADSVAGVAVLGAANAVIAAARAEYRFHSYMALDQEFRAFPGVGLDPAVRESVRRTLAQLGFVAAFLLCLAIANLANLTLIESTRRGTITAIRVALGAGRVRIARGVFVETALLAVSASILALGLAWVWSRWFQGTQLSEYGGELGGMHMDARVMLFTIGAASLAGAFAFLRPATSVRLHSIDRLLRRGAQEDRPAHTARGALVAVQVALSLVLLVAAGLLGRTVANLREIDVGFLPGRLLTFSLDPHLHGYESRELDVLARQLETRLDEVGSIDGAGFISPSPLRSSYITASLYGSTDPEAHPVIGAGFFVSPGFLTTLGTRTMAGDIAGLADSGTVVLTRDALAKVFPDLAPAAAVGRMVPTRAGGKRPLRIVAVIGDVHLSRITGDRPPTWFRPLAERYAGTSLTGFVKAGRIAAATAAVDAVMRRDAPELPIFDIRTAREAVDLQFADRHAMARVASTLGFIGLMLAAVGLYGVLAAMVASRRREIGIRSALGAAPAVILRRALRDGLGPVALGIPLGLLGAMVFSRLLAPQLFGLEALDATAYSIATTALLACTLGAALIPAWRATRVSPAEVLRDD